MLTMRPRLATVLVWFRPVVPRHSPYAVFLMNRDESEWIGMSVIPRFIPNAHEWPLLHLWGLKKRKLYVRQMLVAQKAVVLVTGVELTYLK